MTMARSKGWILAVCSGLGLFLGPLGAWAAHDPDLTNDGVVNILDVSLVSSCYGQALPSSTLVVTMTAPPDASSVPTSPIAVSGTVDNATARVEVNGMPATVSADGTFTALRVPLQEGPNTLTATATTAPPRCLVADTTHDGEVGAGDLDVVVASFGHSGFPLEDPLLPGRVGTASIQVSLTVPRNTTPPQITSPPVTVAGLQQRYQYQVAANDPDGDPLTFALTQAPAGMTIDAASGLITWTPSGEQVGTHPIAVEVSDDKGGTDTQLFAIDVADRVSPVVNLAVPSQVQSASPLSVTAQASDNMGVARVSFYVDELKVQESTAEPHRLDYNAPDEAGRSLTVRAVAEDVAGNQGEDTVQVPIVVAPDTTPPVIEALNLPPTAAPSDQVTVRAEVTDDRGVAGVIFTHAGTDLLEDSTPPYEAPIAIPDDAAVGATLVVSVEAQDAAGNVATAEASFAVASAPDRTAPTGVTIQAPVSAQAGQPVRLTASAVDDVGVLKVVFFADGVEVGEDPQAPYEVEITIPPSQPVDSQVTFGAHALDFAGNQADAAPALTSIVAPGQGFIVGEVYDDTTGLPLASAVVRLVEEGGNPVVPPREVSTDARGRYRLLAAEGVALLAIIADGHSLVSRRPNVLPGVVAQAFDARLTPLRTGTLVDPAAGAELVLNGGDVELGIPAGAFGGALIVTLTRLSGQGLPALLPVGWAPVAAVHIGPEDQTTNAPFDVSFNAAVEADVIVVHWDAATRRWVRQEASATPEGGLAVAVSKLGGIALVRPDVQPAAPPLPAVGEALAGVAEAPIPDGTGAAILPSPDILFMQPGARSAVQAVLNNTAPLPSGTPLAIHVAETYERTDGKRLSPAPSTQDFMLYQTLTGFSAEFVASPSEIFDPVLLRQGVIHLEARQVGDAVGQAIIGAAGGTVAGSGGLSLDIPSGALAANAPVSIAPMSEAPAEIAGEARFAFLGGALINLGGATLASSAALRLELAAPLDPDAVILALQPVRVEGVTRLELIGVAAIHGDSVSVAGGGAGLPLPGILEGGRYFLVQMNEPVGFLTGAVASGGVPPTRALVETDMLPFISLVDSATPRYALAATLGEVRAEGRDLTDGSTGAGGATLDTPAQVAVVDLSLSPSRPTVVSVTPAEGATNIPVTPVVTVQFSRDMDRTTLHAETFTLTPTGGGAVEGTVLLLPDKRTARFQPTRPLVDNTVHTVTLTAAVQDSFGNPLFGNQADGSFVASFTTLNASPTPPPAPGQITLSIPKDGDTEIQGTQGTLNPDDTMLIFNVTQGTQTAASAQPDGSFFITLGAEIDDEIQLVIINQAGVTTPVGSIPFSDPDGTAILGARGGLIKTPTGLEVSVLPQALRETAPVKLIDVPTADLPQNLPPGLTAVAGFRLELPDGLFSTIHSLEVTESQEQFAETQTFTTPLRLSPSYVTSPSVSNATRFTFAARTVDQLDGEMAISITASGNNTACSDPGTTAQDDTAPRIRLNAPRCLGPAQAFTVEAQAIQPRFDFSSPAPAGAALGDTYLLLQTETRNGTTHWLVQETATIISVQGELRIVSQSGAPFGIRRAGEYIVASVSDNLAYVEGIVVGDATLVTTNVSSLAAVSQAGNGAFLLPVFADQPFDLNLISITDGALLAALPIAGIGVDSVLEVGLIGPGAPAPLTVEVNIASGGTVAPTTPLIFSFSEPIVTTTLTPASLVVSDSSDRQVEGETVVIGSGSIAVFRPRFPWRIGENYTYRITTDVVGHNNARLQNDITGQFAGFIPTVVGEIPGNDVTDVVISGTVAYMIDGRRIRSADILDPQQVTEGEPVSPRTVPNRLVVFPSKAAGPSQLLLTTGSYNDFGSLMRYRLDDPLRLVEHGTPVQLSRPSSSSDASGDSGQPAEIAVLDDAFVVSTLGIGLQRIPTAALEGAPGSSVLQYPEGGATFADVITVAGFLASIGIDGLQTHDVDTLQPIARAALTGTPLDLAGAELSVRTLVLVAAGLSGGVQGFEIDEVGGLHKVAQVLPGCAVKRIAVDGPLQRAWFICSNGQLWNLDLARIDGLDPIDNDGNGIDDRLGGFVSLSVIPLALALDAPRSLALVAAGDKGLQIVRLGPDEAVITDVIRDPVAGNHNDEESILDTGQAYYGDFQLRFILDSRIPPGSLVHTASIISSDPNVRFVDGGTDHPLPPGQNALALAGFPTQGTDTVHVRLKLLSGNGRQLNAYVFSVLPVPVNQLSAVSPASVTIGVNADQPNAVASLIGTTADGTAYNVTPLAEFSTSDGAIIEINDQGEMQGAAGGQAQVQYSLGAETGTIAVHANLPPQLIGFDLIPHRIELRSIGEQSQIKVLGTFTTGGQKTLSQADGLEFASQDSGIVSIAPDGTIEAINAGETVVSASINGIQAQAEVVVDVFEPPIVQEIVLVTDQISIASDKGVAFITAWVRGSGSLDNLLVTVTVEGTPDPIRPLTRRTAKNGNVALAIRGLTTAGEASIRARVTNPFDGEVLTAVLPITISAQNQDSEPNDGIGSAVNLHIGRDVKGQVGAPNDSVDIYRYEFTRGGALRLLLSSQDDTVGSPTLAIVDAAGVVLAETQGDGTQLALNIAPGVLYARITATSGTSHYVLRSALSPTPPRIASLIPASGIAGEEILITGEGFSVAAADNLVLFHGIRTDVIEAAADALRVVVPAFATDGPVTVTTAATKSNEVFFQTGTAGDPLAAAFATLQANVPEVTNVFSGNPMVANRLIVDFTPSTTRAQAEAILQNSGGSVIGLWPPINRYTVAFASSQSFSDLLTLQQTLAKEQATRSVMFDYIPVSKAYPISTRDRFPVKIAAAYHRIQVTKAWETLANHGLVPVADSTEPVRVAVIDGGHLVNAGNQQLFDGVVTVVDLFSDCVNDSSCTPPPGPLVDNVPPITGLAHGTAVAGVIGARNVAPADGVGILPNGVLGGLLPETASELPYQITFYDTMYQGRLNATLERRAFEKLLNSGIPPDVINMSYGIGIPLRDPDDESNITPAEIALVLSLCLQGNLEIETFFDDDPGIFCLPGDILTPDEVLFAIADFRQTAIREQIDYYEPYFTFIKSQGSLVVIAAGNENAEARLTYPNAMNMLPEFEDMVISVGATALGILSTDKKRSTSNFGRGVDIAAPGDQVLTVPSKATLDPAMPYERLGGTSFAAPLVAGTAALLKFANPDLDSAALKATLLETATPIDDVNGTTSGSGPTHAWGDWAEPKRLNALTALQSALSLRALAQNDESLLAGRTRWLWTVGRTTAPIVPTGDKLFKVQELATLFSGNAPESVEENAGSLADDGCVDPIGLQLNPSGDKIYLGCFGSNSILAWNANAMQAEFQLPNGELLPGTQVIPSRQITMALSKSGYVFVPLAGLKIGVINTRTDQYLKTIDLSSLNITGEEIVGLAISDREVLYGVTSQPPVRKQIDLGHLFKLPKGSHLWTPSAPSLRVTALPADEPRGVAIRRDTNDDSVQDVVVYYAAETGSFDEAPALAASVHSSKDLTLLSSVDDRLPGAGDFDVRAGAFIPLTSADTFIPFGSSGYETRFTGINRAIDMAIEPLDDRYAYAFFYDTGNIGILNGLSAYNNMAGATTVAGDFQPLTSRQPHLTLQPGQLGLRNTIDLPAPPSLDSVFYFQDAFPSAMDLDQGAELLATFFLSRTPHIRVFNVARLKENLDVFSALGDPAQYPVDTTIGQDGALVLDPEGNPEIDSTARTELLSTRFLRGRDLAFEPQLVIRSPRQGENLTGNVAVNVLVRDPDIENLTIRVFEKGNLTPIESSNYDLTSAEREDGYLILIPHLIKVNNISPGLPASVLQAGGDAFPELEIYSHRLEVLGEKASGQIIKAQVRINININTNTNSIEQPETNDPPQVDDHFAVTNQDQPVTINVLSTATDIDDNIDPASVTIVTLPAQGTAVVDASGQITYTPAAGFFGVDQFTFRLSDTEGEESNIGTITIEVNALPVIPVLQPVVICCVPTEIDVLADAFDPDGQVIPSTLVVESQPARGTAQVNLFNRIVYTPDITQFPPSGPDPFTVSVRDNDNARSLITTVDVQVGFIAILAPVINEVVPGQARVEIYNAGSLSGSIEGFTIAGYTISSDPTRESYSGQSVGGIPVSVTQFLPGGRLVVDLPGVNLATATLILRDDTGGEVDSVNVADTCFDGSNANLPSLSRKADGFKTPDPCISLEWVDPPTLGAPN